MALRRFAADVSFIAGSEAGEGEWGSWNSLQSSRGKSVGGKEQKGISVVIGNLQTVSYIQRALSCLLPSSFLCANVLLASSEQLSIPEIPRPWALKNKDP